ncbi:MAG: radical SAM protein [Ruminococcaceae bacterium]|nr:radical SAM protein [Oscillospiraceae bacterium]
MKKGNISIFVPHLGCPQQCSFCNQKTITGTVSQPTADDVRNAVRTALNKKGYEYEIAFFGGSFTAIDRTYMQTLLQAAYECVDGERVKGIRISTRPDCIDGDVLALLKENGVTSIELGAQSMDDEVLKANLRGHTAADVVTASKMIQDSGFALGLQMMTGLYLDTDEKAIETAKKLIALHPETVRIYPTVVLKGTYLAELYDNEVYKPQTVDDAAALCTKLLPMFEKAGIKVIRLGLHASNDIKKNMVAGAYHESFGEIVQSRFMLNKVLAYPPGNYEIKVNPRSVSKLKGNQKRNVYFLMEEGYNIKFTVTDRVAVDELKIVRR